MALLLVVASISGQLTKYLAGHDQVYGLVALFDVDQEQSIPTVYAVLLLFCAALLLAVIAVLKKQERDPDAPRWTILALGFLFMAVDEVASLHEKLVPPLRRLLGGGRLGIFYFTWVIPGMAVVVVVAVLYVRFLLRLPPNTRATFLVAGMLFIGGVLGLELVGGRYAELHGRKNLRYSMLATVEESLEMAGMIVFIYALLTYLAQHYDEVRLGFDGRRGSPRSKS